MTQATDMKQTSYHSTDSTQPLPNSSVILQPVQKLNYLSTYKKQLREFLPSTGFPRVPAGVYKLLLRIRCHCALSNGMTW